MNTDNSINLSCPLPHHNFDTVQLAHGGGGKMMHELLDRIILPPFKNKLSDLKHDGAVFKAGNTRLAFTTDSYVINPIFFPGGDIGSLAVHGTVNDLAMCGARPLYLSAGLIIEEGFAVEKLSKIVLSMHMASMEAMVELITGDTKVVDKGKGDGIFINTSGIGLIENDYSISPTSVQPGDLILINGDIGRHGIAIMSVREGLSFESTIESDSAELGSLIMELIRAGIEIHCMRDLTRGGLASALVEISGTGKLKFEIDEARIPVRDDVKGACEILGFDPLYVANEGRFIAFVTEKDAERALSIMHAHREGKGATQIGRVHDGSDTGVVLKSVVGTHRPLDMMSGEQLPRIC